MINFALIFNYIYLAIFGYQMLYFVVQYALLEKRTGKPITLCLSRQSADCNKFL